MSGASHVGGATPAALEGRSAGVGVDEERCVDGTQANRRTVPRATGPRRETNKRERSRRRGRKTESVHSRGTIVVQSRGCWG